MPTFLNPTRNVLHFGACPPKRLRSVSLYPDTTFVRTMPVDGVLVIELSDLEAAPYLQRGLLKAVVAAPSAPVTAKDVLGKVETFMSSSIGSPEAKAIPPGRPMPAPVEVAKKPEPIVEKKVDPPTPAVIPAPKKAFKPKGFATPKKANPQKFVSPPVSVKEYDDALSDSNPMRAKEAAQDALAEGKPGNLAAALAKIKAAVAPPEQVVQEPVPTPSGPVTSPFKDDVGPVKPAYFEDESAPATTGAPLDTTPPTADTPSPSSTRRRYSAE